MWATSVIFIKLPIVNNRPLDENLPCHPVYGTGVNDLYRLRFPLRLPRPPGALDETELIRA
jgi:hypothetical protein